MTDPTFVSCRALTDDELRQALARRSKGARRDQSRIHARPGGVQPRGRLRRVMAGTSLATA